MSNLQFLINGAMQASADVGFGKRDEAGNVNVSIDTLNALKNFVTGQSPTRGRFPSPILSNFRGRSASPLAELPSPDLAFSASLMSNEIPVPDGYKMRPLAAADYEKGYLDCLAQLTTVGNVTKEQFLDRYNNMKNFKGMYYPIVIEEESSHKIVALGTILIELKFIHEASSVGHIEDIVVHDSMRGKNMGRLIIEQLKELGKQAGCYKIILNCAERNIGFYEKLGFTKKEVEMVARFDGK